jgi:hypothetical protein
MGRIMKRVEIRGIISQSQLLNVYLSIDRMVAKLTKK